MSRKNLRFQFWHVSLIFQKLVTSGDDQFLRQSLLHLTRAPDEIKPHCPRSKPLISSINAKCPVQFHWPLPSTALPKSLAQIATFTQKFVIFPLSLAFSTSFVSRRVSLVATPPVSRERALSPLPPRSLPLTTLSGSLYSIGCGGRGGSEFYL